MRSPRAEGQIRASALRSSGRDAGSLAPTVARVGATAATTVAVLLLVPSATFGQTSQTWQVVEYYDTDALGSVRAVTDKDGAVVARHDFLPFGEELVPQTADKKLFTGQERDFETGQDYVGARQLRTDLGRFLAPDPMTLVPRRVGSQGVNSYAYVRNNPLGLIDPNGLDPSAFDNLPIQYTDGSPTDLPAGSIVGLIGESNWQAEQAEQQSYTIYACSVNAKDGSLQYQAATITIAGGNVTAAAAGASEGQAGFTNAELKTISTVLQTILKAGAGMTLSGSQVVDQKLILAIAAKESTLGLRDQNNPLQCTACNTDGSALANDKAALAKLNYWGQRAGWDPSLTYLGYNGGYTGLKGTNKAANAHGVIFDIIYNSIQIGG